jgi:SagB-type dehydrogenase family enzyme
MPDAAPPIAWTFHRGTVHGWQGDAPWTSLPLVSADAGFLRPGETKAYPAAARLSLPPPEALTASLGEAIAQRLSCRRFAKTALPLTRLSTLLRHGYGLGTSYRVGDWETSERPLPSAGACYPLELYLFIRRVEGVEEGTYHYCVRDSALEFLGPAPSPTAVGELFLNQPWLADAQAVVVATAVPSRLLHRYGDRGYRYLLIEAGHLGQNLALVAAATGSASLCLGGFFDDELSRVLGLDPMLEVPLYGVAVGVSETADRLQVRGHEAP